MMYTNSDNAAALMKTSSIASIVFVIPFILFCPFLGYYSDKYPKSLVIQLTKFLEIIVMLMATLAFYIKSAVLGYASLFMMAFQSSFFAPAKFGIIPEITKRNELNYSNSYVSATNSLATLMGTFLAPFLWERFGTSSGQINGSVTLGFICVCIAIIGFCNTLFITKTKPQKPTLKIKPRMIYSAFISSITLEKKEKNIINILLWSGMFTLILNIGLITVVPFGVSHLGLVKTNSLKLLLAPAIVGVIIGSFVVSNLSKDKIHLHYTHRALVIVPLLFITLAMIGFLVPQQTTSSMFVGLSCTTCFLIGLTASFFLIPVETYLHITVSDTERARVEATKGQYNFLAALTAGVLSGLSNAINMSPASIMFIYSFVTICIYLYLRSIVEKKSITITKHA